MTTIKRIRILSNLLEKENGLKEADFQWSLRIEDFPYGNAIPCPGNEKTGLIDQRNWRVSKSH